MEPYKIGFHEYFESRYVLIWMGKWGGRGQNLKNDDVILGGRGLRIMMVDDGGGEGGQKWPKSDDVINGRPPWHFL